MRWRRVLRGVLSPRTSFPPSFTSLGAAPRLRRRARSRAQPYDSSTKLGPLTIAFCLYAFPCDATQRLVCKTAPCVPRVRAPRHPCEHVCNAD